MIFTETTVAGAMLVTAERLSDERGSFERVFCEREFAAAGLETNWPQRSLSSNVRAGTLRGMHYAVTPAPETKLINVSRGAIFDVILDLRPDSPTFLKWYGIKLTAGDGYSLYVPIGVAHGFQTLVDDTTVHYAISEFYDPTAARGVRWNDPAFGIDWPVAEKRIVSTRDASYPDFTP
ncbi:dTDP-4-dehydrorhamnose 3,5-epimerase family protein [Bosea sp. (in: a-proteobacteria)]|uniref:dTDP-4-dehydrorhamnose 3,5-epimerase family protein n=1 Tax=Bosea sp. (in: a-proteobacteria) TaxID=1871050 RepID=UPI002DDCD8CD|nr:dTDP-4-dehydrorhamnose 3,5-epimerase family protein [Bosea sp. (in: a-proteobacteria)]HEV2508991.1 dTDP-4-dehydrorhamnose 3,5-epimerase family protein [Bosea sp. (in: a-proteobacteria)]